MNSLPFVWVKAFAPLTCSKTEGKKGDVTYTWQGQNSGFSNLCKDENHKLSFPERRCLLQWVKWKGRHVQVTLSYTIIFHDFSLLDGERVCLAPVCAWQEIDHKCSEAVIPQLLFYWRHQLDHSIDSGILTSFLHLASQSVDGYNSWNNRLQMVSSFLQYGDRILPESPFQTLLMFGLTWAGQTWWLTMSVLLVRGLSTWRILSSSPGKAEVVLVLANKNAHYIRNPLHFPRDPT